MRVVDVNRASASNVITLHLFFFVLVEQNLHEFECIMWKYDLHISSCKQQNVFKLNLVFGVYCPSILYIVYSSVT
jgi:hypothetical protein